MGMLVIIFAAITHYEGQPEPIYEDVSISSHPIPLTTLPEQHMQVNPSYASQPYSMEDYIVMTSGVDGQHSDDVAT